jgi:hypothetical protein
MRVEDVGARVRVNGLSLSDFNPDRMSGMNYDGEVDMFSGYIFDVEGTLVDSMAQNLSSLQEALEQAGFDIPMRPCNCTPASMRLRHPSASRSCSSGSAGVGSLARDPLIGLRRMQGESIGKDNWPMTITNSIGLPSTGT